MDAAGDGEVLVVMDLRPDDELVAAGLAREVVNRVQRLRKKAGLQATDAGGWCTRRAALLVPLHRLAWKRMLQRLVLRAPSDALSGPQASRLMRGHMRGLPAGPGSA